MFFTHDRGFYKRLAVLMVTLALQNLIAYSVNMADNIMLGGYSQTTLSGASTVNQIFFMIQQLALGIGDSLVILGSQYWGKGEVSRIRRLTGIALKFTGICCLAIFLLCTLFPSQLLSCFTGDRAIIEEGLAYLSIVKYSFLLFLITNCLMSALRCVEVVRISFIISVISLLTNVSINYLLIFGKHGCPELGIRGAAIGTLVARALELVVILAYVCRREQRLRLFSEPIFCRDPELAADYRRTAIPTVMTELLWGISVPMQTGILGHLTADAIAANSVASTFYTYLKVVVRALASAAAVLIGAAIGEGDLTAVKEKARTISVAGVTVGAVMGLLLFVLRTPLLSCYKLNPAAMSLADQMMILYSFIMVAMSFQMTICNGVIRAGGDVRFTTALNLISVWAIVIPISFLCAFVWKVPIMVTVLAVQSDQIFKGLPIWIRLRSYRWIRTLTRSAEESL